MTSIRAQIDHLLKYYMHSGVCRVGMSLVIPIIKMVYTEVNHENNDYSGSFRITTYELCRP